ncbi:MAG: putative metallopeptidase [Thermomicrobiales bacterium]
MSSLTLVASAPLATADRYPVPGPGRFIDDVTAVLHDVVDAPDLARIAGDLIAEFAEEEFRHLADVPIAYLWKREGGASGGLATYGKCSRRSGPARYDSQRHFLIWAAADHCRADGFTHRQMRALVYHELSPIGCDLATGKLMVVGHDATVFYQELRRFGAWMPNLRTVGDVFEQLRLEGLS